MYEEQEEKYKKSTWKGNLMSKQINYSHKSDT